MAQTAAVAVLTGIADVHAAFGEHLKELRDISLNEPGTLMFTVSTLNERPPRFLIIEMFVDYDAYLAHESNSDVLAVADRLRPLLASAEVTVGNVLF